MALTKQSVILDDRSLSESRRRALRTCLKSEPQVSSLGGFIPELKASAAGIVAGVSTALTTVYVLIPNKAKDTASEVVKDLVSKWLQKELFKDEEPGECVTILDQYGHPAVKVKLRQTPVSKRK